MKLVEEFLSFYEENNLIFERLSENEIELVKKCTEKTMFYYISANKSLTEEDLIEEFAEYIEQTLSENNEHHDKIVQIVKAFKMYTRHKFFQKEYLMLKKELPLDYYEKEMKDLVKNLQ